MISRVLLFCYSGLQNDYKKACALADEKSRDVKNLCDQLFDREQRSEALNSQLRLMEKSLSEIKQQQK